MYALMAFPIVDYGLRSHAHPLGVIWDKVVLLILAIVAVIRYSSGYRVRLSWQKFAVYFILFALALMFAGMGQPLVSLQGFRIDVYYILYAFVIPFVVTPKDVIRLLHAGALVAILIAVHCIFQYVTKVPIPPDWVNVGEHVRTRVFSVLQSPNELGSYMALSIPILAGLFLYETHRVRKWLYGFGTGACALALVFSSTRGAWVALVLAVVITAVVFERRLLIAVVILGVVAFFLPPIHHRLAELYSPVYWIKSTQAGRIARWLTAFDKMSANPLFGVGLGHYGGAVSAIYHSGIYSDNYYAKTLGETGLVGLTLFISMHVALVRDVLQRTAKKMAGKSRYVVIGGVTGLLAVLIHNTMENVFEFAPMVVTYFVYAALFLVWGFDGDAEEVNVEHAEAASVL
jgi:O-antigen ligase